MTTTTETWMPASTAEISADLAAPSSEALAPRVKTRDLAFDAARLIASMAIVWVHTPRSIELIPFTALGSFGTSFFTGAFIYFMAQGLIAQPTRSLSRYARSRFLRLYVPFIAWSVLYLLFRNFSRHFVSHLPPVELVPMNLLTGGEIHLWFLPFAFFASLVAFPIVKFGLSLSPAQRNSLALICALIGFFFMLFFVPPVQMPGDDQTNFFISTRLVVPSLLLGIALGLSHEAIRWLRDRSSWVHLVAAAVTITLALFMVGHGVLIWAKNLAGISWLIVALTLPPIRCRAVLAKYAPLGFGLYLVHPFVQGCLRAVGSLAHLEETAGYDIFVFAMTILIGLLLAGQLHRNRRLGWLVP